MPNLQELNYNLFDNDGNAITGANVTAKLRRTAGGFLFDWSDATFKSADWVTLSGALTEVDATNLPGLYQTTIDVSLLSDGLYSVYFSHPLVPSQPGAIEIYVKGGKLIDAAIPTATENASAVGARIIEGVLTADEIVRITLASNAGDAMVPSVAGSYDFKAQDGVKKRIEGSVDANGNRTVTSVNGS